MKKGFLVALCIVAVSMLMPQVASAATPADNYAEVTAYLNTSGTTVTVTGVTAVARVNIIGPAFLQITKLVRNVTRDGAAGPLSTVQSANKDDIVEYEVTITNNGEDTANDVRFRDTLYWDGMVGLSIVSLPPELMQIGFLPDIIESNPGAINLPGGGGQIILNYRAVVITP